MICGSVAGIFVVRILASVPAFILPRSEAGLVLVVLSVWAIRIGVPLGAAIGGYAALRGALGRCAIAAVVAFVVGPTIIWAAEDRLREPAPVAANGCVNEPRSSEFLMGGHSVTLFKRSCPGRSSTMEVTILPTGQVMDFTAPGNALVLDAAADSPRHQVTVSAMSTPDSVVTLTYDSRARVVSQQAAVGAVKLRLVPDSLLTPGGVEQMVGVGPSDHVCRIQPFDRIQSPAMYAVAFQRDCVGSRTLNVSVFEQYQDLSGSDSGNVLVLDFPPGPDSLRAMVMFVGKSADLEITHAEDLRVLSRQTHLGRFVVQSGPVGPPRATSGSGAADSCTHAVREEVASTRWALRVVRKDCPGKRPVLEATVAPRYADLGLHAGNAFVLDASAETPGDTLRVRLVWADSSVITVGYDRRARVVRTASRVNGMRIRLFPASTADLRLGGMHLVNAWQAAR